MKTLIIVLTALWSLQSQAGIFPKVVDDLELDSYLGKWYQIASTNPIFQRNCVCVTAEYEINDAGNVNVINSCRKQNVNAELELAVGEARATQNSAKFNVTFGGFSLPFSNYWVVDLADDYSWAVVSSPLRTPIWILSRSPELDEGIYSDIVENLKERRFNVKNLTPTLQAGCDN